MSLVKRVAKGILWAQVGSVIETVLGFALSVFVIRKLGPADYGVYGVLTSVTMLLPFLTRLGLDEALGKYIPALTSQGESAKAAFLFRLLFLVRAGVIVLSVGILFLVSGPLGQALRVPDFTTYMGALALLFITQEIGQVFAALFTAELRLQYITVYNLILRCVSLGLTLFLFARYGVAVRYVLYASIAGLAAGLIWFFLSARRTLATPGERTPIGPAMRFGAGICLINLTQIGLGSQKDILLLGMLAQDIAEAGYYKTSSGLVSLIHGFLFSRWAGMTVPVLSEAHSRQGNDGLRQAWTSYIKLMSAVAVPVFGYFAVFAAPLVHLVLTDAYVKSIHLLQIWSVVTIATTVMGHGLSTAVLYVIDKERIALLFRLAGALVAIGLDVLLIPRLGALGAIIASGIVSIAIVITEVFFAARYIGRLRYPLLFVGKLALSTLVGCLPAILLNTSQAWAFALASALFFALFLTMLRILRPLEQSDREMVARLAPRLASLLIWF